MHSLSHEQQTLIATCVSMSGVDQSHLQVDLIDHVCSMVEERLEQGVAFESALNEALGFFGTDGLRNIQKEVYSVITPNTMIMKRMTVVTGAVCSTLLLVGTFFKVMHWAPAGVLIVLGMALLVVPFLPLLLLHNLRGSSELGGRIFHISGYLGLSVLAAGALFKIMHWPYASMLLAIGGGVLLFVYLPLYFYRKYQESSNKPVTLATFLVSFAALMVVYMLLPR